MKRASSDGRKLIETRSSKPHHHPKEISHELESLIIAYRHDFKRDAVFIHHLLRESGVAVSLSTVKRTLQRNRLTYPSRMKIWHQYPPRPKPEKPGSLVEIDTIHVGEAGDQLLIYTLIDVRSRWTHALPVPRINTHRSLSFVGVAQEEASFDFQTVQSDHGAEFSKWFTQRLTERGMAHRHSRIRTPNDNAHIERFNRTIQQECINRIPMDLRIWQREIPQYIRYYNTERPHMGLGMKTPAEILTMVPSY
jgi:transposase InsO family protein